MIAHKKEFFGGVAMMAVFVVVLIIIFMPVFGGQNGLNYLEYGLSLVRARAAGLNLPLPLDSS